MLGGGKSKVTQLDVNKRKRKREFTVYNYFKPNGKSIDEVKHEWMLYNTKIIDIVERFKIITMYNGDEGA